MTVATLRLPQEPDVVARRIEMAVAMIARGAAVFPLSHNSKVPWLPKQSGGAGFRDAHRNADMARTFLSQPGQLNYGVVFPEGSDIIVLDLDGGDRSSRPTWREEWQALYDRLGPPGLTFIVKTPSGGRHAYYRWRVDLYGPLPSGDEMLGWTVRKPWKGYLVGPGSVVNGLVYEPSGIEAIADLPESWARAALAETKSRPEPSRSPTLTIKGPAQVEVGHRHAYLRDQARHLVGIGLSGDALFTAVMDLNGKLTEPKTADEVRRAIGEAEARFEPDEVTQSGERVAPRYPDELDLLPGQKTGDFPGLPAPAAYGGLLGECVEDLAPGTDASRVGLLGFLVAFCGALVPGIAYFHRLQTSSPFVALVGESSIGRKGTAMTRVADAMAQAVGTDSVNRVILDGLNSGEALVATLHYKREKYPYELTAGLVFEEEYASLIAARSRDGSTLDPKMRQAFDGGPISNRRAGETKTIVPPYWLPALIGITPSELRLRLEAGALQSGSANRWLYLPVQRRVNSADNSEPIFAMDHRTALIEARRETTSALRTLGVAPGVSRTLAEYADFVAGSAHGVARDLTRRLAVIAFRVALVHALVERSAVVMSAHLDRALALTEYARSGVGWVFGETVGSPDADLLLRQLLAAGRLSKNAITREIIRDPLRRQAAIDELVRLDRAAVVTTHPEGGGRARTELVPTGKGGSFVHFVQASVRSVQTSVSPHVENIGNVDGMDETPLLSVEGVDETWTKLGQDVDETPVHLEVSPDAKASAIPTCRAYSDHQSNHRYTPAGWVCDLCGGEAPA